MAAAFGIAGLSSQSNAVKFYYSKRKESGPKEARRSAVGRQHLSNTPPPPAASCDDELEIGAFYEIDHKKLPPKSPIHLKAVRVVKVSEITKLDVTVSFPSTYSLRNYFSLIAADPASADQQIPELDEMFVMSTNNAGKILKRQVPTSQMNEEKNLQSFWLLVAPFVQPSSTSATKSAAATAEGEEDEEEEEEDDDDDDDDEEEQEHGEEEESKSATQSVGGLQLALKYSGNLEWGIRRKVRFVSRQQRELECLPASSTREGGDEGVVAQNVACTRKRAREQGKLMKNNKKEKIKAKVAERKEMKSRRRKKRGRYENHAERINKHEGRESGRGRSVVSKDRWSAERYESAELKLMDIMREKGAVLGSPILRQELREEARKHIGDTGLLDHLLKHMAGKCVSDRNERFRRRHNAEGAMEYWLEPAELDEVRRKAGVMDPYWLPPPGWKPGDSTSSCSCGSESQKEISLIREEIGILKRNLEELLSLRQLEKEAKDANEQSEAAAACMGLQEKYEKLAEKNGKLEEEMSVLMSSVKELKEEMESLKKQEEKGAAKKEGEEKSDTCVHVTLSAINEGDDDDQGNTRKVGGGRRSGFRICKPHGTFIWPNMGAGIGGSSSNISASTVATASTAAAVHGSCGIGVVPMTKSMEQLQFEYHHHQHQLAVMFGGGDGGGGVPTPPSCSSGTSASKLLLLPSPTTPKSSTSSSPAPPLLPGVGQQPQQMMMLLPRGGEPRMVPLQPPPSATPHAKLAAAGEDAAAAHAHGGAHWSGGGITTDLVLATPSHYNLTPLN